MVCFFFLFPLVLSLYLSLRGRCIHFFKNKTKVRHNDKSKPELADGLLCLALPTEDRVIVLSLNNNENFTNTQTKACVTAVPFSPLPSNKKVALASHHLPTCTRKRGAPILTHNNASCAHTHTHTTRPQPQYYQGGLSLAQMDRRALALRHHPNGDSFSTCRAP